MVETLNPERNGKVLIADDDPEVRGYLAMALRCHGFEVDFAEDGNEVVTALRNANGPLSALLLDIMMPRKSGLLALREIREFDRDLPVIVISGASSSLQVVEAMRAGATDFLAKPVSHDALCKSLQSVLNGSWSRPAPAPAESVGTARNGALFAGTKTRYLEQFLRKVAPTDAPMLILGETGTGKEVIARFVHAHSPRASKPFVKLNCAALPSELVESELFGYERGAFTGAFQKKAGMFEMADRGTLLLDEIGDMDIRLQAKLLQVLQDQTFQHLGGKETIRVNVRVLAATHRDLEQAIAEEKFREDLYYRLNVISVQLPPLRERKDEIIPLAELLMARHRASGAAMLPIPPDLRNAMLEHAWPGNVRELENAMRRYLILQDPGMLAMDLRMKALRRSGSSQKACNTLHVLGTDTSAGRVLDEVQRAKDRADSEAIIEALQSTGWNRKRAAGLLEIEYKALLYKMKKLAIEETAVTEPADAHEGKPPGRVTFAARSQGRSDTEPEDENLMVGIAN
jgi:two-component system response regulator AtoC